MKAIIFISLFISSLAIAKDFEVVSFRKVDNNSYIGELCAKVKGENDPHDRLIVTVDPEHNPGPYTLHPDKDGSGCILVLTYTNRASVEYWFAGHEHAKKSKSAKTIVTATFGKR